MRHDLRQAGVEADETLDEALESAPGPWRQLVDHATRSHSLTLAAGLAFFGLISIAPAISFAFGVLRIALPDALVNSMTGALENTFPPTLGLADLIDQMQDRAGRYAGLSLLVLLWPATTLASGWTRALDAVNGENSSGGIRGLRGRLRGLLLGGVLLLAFLALLGAVAAASAMAGEGRVVTLVLIGAAAVAVQFGMCLGIYRWLPSYNHPLRTLWPGAVAATVGVVAATVGFTVGVRFADQLSQQYPPTLATSVVIGLWLYAANLSLLLGEEYNAIRRREREGEEHEHLDPDGPRGGRGGEK